MGMVPAQAAAKCVAVPVVDGLIAATALAYGMTVCDAESDRMQSRACRVQPLSA
jgi:predicted nucleic acid-binding protein